MTVPYTEGVLQAISRLRELLARARQLKPRSIEPPLPPSEFSGHLGLGNGRSKFVAVELASRQLFEDLVGKTTIDDPEFVNIWNLLDILSICGDQGQCEPALVWWLIEELLETQRIDGCRTVFDYLESRRERLIAKHFTKQKDLVILRAFNELLRRLSRAEEAVFCGRVFMFLFQSFPLGARSSVNPKGEFHTDNVTTFEAGTTTEGTYSDMIIDTPPADRNTSQPAKNPAVSDSISSLSENAFYPIFWRLQQAFSNPPHLFKDNNFEEFRKGLDATLTKFREVPTVSQGMTSDLKHGTKRTADEMEREGELANTFNPKYLTSRDLFSLELSDLAFQRHILVQALILLDFVLSLTDKAKKRLAHLTTQKALQYEFTLNDQDMDWAEKTKRTISNYILSGPDGKFYLRMVETVLSRDKNWVRWKLENCPLITRQPLASDDFVVGKNGAKNACLTKKLRATPLGSLDLRFLSDAENVNTLERSDKSARFTLPELNTLVTEVGTVKLDLEFATTDAEKKLLQDTEASKTWRALRLAAKTKLSLLDKVDDGKNLEALLETPFQGESNIEGGEMTAVSGGMED